MTSSEPLRILIYSQDGFGLGHLRRNLNIAHEIITRRPHTASLLLTDSQVAPFFELPQGMDFVKLPSIRKVGAGDWESVRVPIDVDEACALRAALIEQTALNFGPDIFLVDHMPLGARGELRPALLHLKREHPRTRLVLGLRDILDAPEAIIRSWQRDGAYEMLDVYDRILIYGSPDVFDPPRAYEFPRRVQHKIRYCGYVTSDAPYVAPEQIRSEVGLSSARFITVMVGGGADGFPVMQAYVGALAQLNGRLNFQSLIVTGPFMDTAQREQLYACARDVRETKIITQTHHSRSLIAASAVVVCMAGYNTLTEVLRARRPALTVPRAGPSAEQRTRALLFLEHGYVQALATPDTAASVLAEQLDDLLADPRAPRDPLPPLQGAQRAADEILALVSEESWLLPAVA